MTDIQENKSESPDEREKRVEQEVASWVESISRYDSSELLTYIWTYEIQQPVKLLYAYAQFLSEPKVNENEEIRTLVASSIAREVEKLEIYLRAFSTIGQNRHLDSENKLSE